MVNNLDSQVKAAQEAVGLAYLPSVIVRSYLKDGRLRRVLKDWEGPQGVIHLVFSRPLNLLPSVRNLIDHISTRLPEIIESARL
jgi:DNA-binding transcriptional LysR family regulator